MSLRRCVLSALICGSMVGVPGPISTWAQETSESPPNKSAVLVENILNVGKATYRSASEREAAFGKLANIPSAETSDPRIAYAKILVATELKKNTVATSASNELVTKAPDYLPARVLKTRQLLTANKLTQAVVELESLVEQLSKPLSSDVTDEQAIAVARFVGMAIGYLEGPASSTFKAAGLKAVLADAEALPTEYKAAFEEQRAAVAEEHATVVEHGESALDELRNKKHELDQSNVELRKQLDEQRSKVEQNAEESKKQLQAQWTQLNDQYKQVYAQCVALNGNAVVLQNQYNDLQTSYNLLRPPLADQNGNVDQFALSQYFAQRSSIESNLNRVSNDMIRVSGQYQQARMVGASLEQRMNQVSAESQKLGMALQRQAQSLGQLDKEIKMREAVAKKKEPKKSNAALRYERAFTTYDDFNFFRESKLLLESYE